ncbi:hypothetical protein STRIP9103_03008 [Streptomyces ipomoeae 91-03]|uniref:Uncharacterized protein n=1 Tax=Streptomyces ipomoeae 91-03 TaxID=698759 RepID=L1L4D5_9ACTN|nr:hypothetical protein STRIP9103_03008 [Streptomyces ipomoeae 91-03]
MGRHGTGLLAVRHECGAPLDVRMDGRHATQSSAGRESTWTTGPRRGS